MPSPAATGEFVPAGALRHHIREMLRKTTATGACAALLALAASGCATRPSLEGAKLRSDACLEGCTRRLEDAAAAPLREQTDALQRQQLIDRADAAPVNAAQTRRRLPIGR
jgi:hypothetical protein